MSGRDGSTGCATDPRSRPGRGRQPRTVGEAVGRVAHRLHKAERKVRPGVVAAGEAVGKRAEERARTLAAGRGGGGRGAVAKNEKKRMGGARRSSGNRK